MKNKPRYISIRDYLHVIRRYWLMVVIITAAFGGAAYWASSKADKEYQAEASLSFADNAQDSGLLGLPDAPVQASEERAAVNAEAVTRPTTVRRVKKRLNLRDKSVEDIQEDVSARPEARTNLVVIQAKAGGDKAAARLANTFATVTKERYGRAQEARYARAARTLRNRFERFKKQTKDRFSRAVYAERISRLEALRDFAEPVQIARRAEVPESPEKPKPLRDTILGALLGLALALVVAFVRDALDRRLRGTDDIEGIYELPLLAQVSRHALGRTPFPSNSHDTLSLADQEAFRILRTGVDVLRPDQPIRSVLVTSALPEEGKTTVATCLAATNAAAGRRTLLIECDLRRPTLAKRLGIAPRPGLSDILSKGGSLSDVTQVMMLSSPSSNGSQVQPAARDTLHCVTAGTTALKPAELLSSSRMRELLEKEIEAYDLVVLDSAPLLPVADTMELLPLAEATLLCVKASSTTHQEAHATKSLFDRIPGRPAGLVVTGLRGADKADYGYYAHSYSYSSDAS